MDELLIIKPMRPKGIDEKTMTGRGWVRWSIPPVLPNGSRPYALEYWYNRGHEVQVLSSIEVVSGEGPDRPEYHVSISALPWMGRVKRCSEWLARWVLKEFEFTDYTQDNHVPNGIVRNYWRPVAENTSPICHCVETEPKIVEDKGDFIWRP